MANTSIRDAFERMWQHTTAKCATKEDLNILEADIDNAYQKLDLVPDYVERAANSMIDRILSAQRGNNIFNLAAISDLHYGEGSYTDGIKHACQALKYIDGRLKLDAVAVLGDYTDGYPSTGIENALGDFKAVNGLLDQLRFAPNLRQQGNHDYYADSIQTTRRLIQNFSGDVVWGSRAGGYYYRDFADHKLRIIVPNTNENNPMDSSTNKPSSSISMTTEQIQWLINTLDMSAKSDVEDWNILILSHHPLDYWTSDSKYILGYILNAYNTGGSWSGEGLSCNFAGKNGAKLIGNIHGHIHNHLTAKMFMGSPNNNNKIDVYRSCVPNACFGRENQYTGAWGDSITYTKEKNGELDTAFVVYTINMDDFTVYRTCYGQGLENTFNFGDVSLQTYTITNNLTNVINSNSATTIVEGQSYTATLTSDGVITIAVTMGGTNVTSSVFSNGVITIPFVTGDIVINATGAIPVNYTNQIPLSINNSGGQYVGDNGEDGYRYNYRLNSSGTETGATDLGVTGFIPVKKGDVIYVKNMQITPSATGGKNEYTYVSVYNSAFSMIGSNKFNSLNAAFTGGVVTDDAGYLSSFQITDTENKGIAYMRISCAFLDNTAIITVNEPIE